MSLCPPSRIQNYPDPEPSCRYCLDDGMVDVPTPKHPGGDGRAQAPCPHCARGFRIEFAIGVKRKRNYSGQVGAVEDDWWPNPQGGPWGKDGYWQGRDITGVQMREPVTEVKGRPDWVVRWTRARIAGDPRLFPEQLSALEEPPGEPLTDRNVYVQPDEYLHAADREEEYLRTLLASV